VAFVPPSSNLIGSGLGLLLGLAGRDRRPWPTDTLPYGLQLVLIGPRRLALEFHLFRGTQNPPYRVPRSKLFHFAMRRGWKIGKVPMAGKLAIVCTACGRATQFGTGTTVLRVSVTREAQQTSFSWFSARWNRGTGVLQRTTPSLTHWSAYLGSRKAVCARQDIPTCVSVFRPSTQIRIGRQSARRGEEYVHHRSGFSRVRRVLSPFPKPNRQNVHPA